MYHKAFKKLKERNEKLQATVVLAPPKAIVKKVETPSRTTTLSKPDSRPAQTKVAPAIKMHSAMPGFSGFSLKSSTKKS